MKASWKNVLIPGVGFVFLAACLGLSAFNYARLHEQGEVGLFIIAFPQPGAVVTVSPGSPAARAGIQANDRVLAINDIAITDAGKLASLEQRVRRGDPVSYRVRRGNKEFTVTLRPESPFLETGWLIRMSAEVIVGMLYLFVGSFILSKKRGDRRALVFYWISIISTSYFINAPTVSPALAARLGEPLTHFGLQSGLSYFVQSALRIMLVPLLLHLALVFPKEHRVLEKYPTLIRWVYWFPVSFVFVLLPIQMMVASIRFRTYTMVCLAVVAAVGMGYLLRARARHRQIELRSAWIPWCIRHPFATLLGFASASSVVLSAITLLSPFIGISRARLVNILSIVIVAPPLLAFLVYPIATCWVLYSSFRESRLEEKRQLQWPLWGLTASLAGRFLLSLVMLGVVLAFGRSFPGPALTLQEILAAALAALVPLSFAVAILKYRLMEINLIIKRTVLYSLFTGIIVCLYLGIVGGLGGLLVRFTGMRSQSVAVLATVVVAAVFLPLRTRVQGMVEQRLFRKRRDYPEILKRLREQMPAVAHFRELATLVAESAQEAVQSRTAVFFFKETAGFLRCAAKVGLPDEALEGLRLSEKSTLLRAMNGPYEPRQQSWSEEDELVLRQAVSALLVPVRFKGDLVGVISLGPKISGESYDADDREFLATLAYQAGVSIENQRLGEQESELEKAREIQEALLPKQIPHLAGYSIAGAWQPARGVGGDYYDVFSVAERKLALCIADVSGKGLPAALLMSNLQAAVRTIAAAAMEPKQLCERVNQVIHNNVGTGRFISFFYCLLDADNQHLTYTNAGHNPPLIMRKSGTVERLEEGGLVLGIFPDTRFAQGEAELAVGERLLLFTDGVSEAANSAQQEFGEERLAAALRNAPDESAEALQRYVMTKVTEFCDNCFHDDASVLAVVATRTA